MWCVWCVKRIMYSLPLANVLALSQGSSTQSFEVVRCINQVEKETRQERANKTLFTCGVLLTLTSHKQIKLSKPK